MRGWGIPEVNGLLVYESNFRLVKVQFCFKYPVKKMELFL